MNRRDFVIQSGAFITATALMSFTSKTGLDKIENFKATHSEKRKDDFTTFDKPILKAIAMGLYAPSAHNTQAWKFKIVSDTQALFYVDKKRLLPETDPPARQIHISCGCFLEALSIGCSGINYLPNIQLFPEGEYSFHEIGIKPIASIDLKKTATSKHPLWDSIFRRRMARTEYVGNLIKAEEHEIILKYTEIKYSNFKLVNDIESIKQYSKIFADAMKIEYDTITKNEETRRMFRFTDSEAETKRDGLTFDANGIVGFSKKLAQMFTKNTTESWNKTSTKNAGFKGFMKGLDSTKGFIFFTTDKNTFSSQVNVGRDFYQYCLALTKNGYYMHPLNQAIQEYTEMDILRGDLDKLYKVKSEEKIQMIARIGKSELPFESYRRHLDNFDVK